MNEMKRNERLDDGSCVRWLCGVNDGMESNGMTK